MSNSGDGPSRKEKQKSSTRQEIVTTAWSLVGTHGMEGLSFRKIAQSMGLTAPALYRYFPCRDELITVMIIESFRSFRESQERACIPVAATAREAMIRLGLAYREWAIGNPAGFSLIFGDPIPGYEAPLERVMPCAEATLLPLLGLLERAKAQGSLRLPILPPASPALAGMMKTWAEAGNGVDPEILYLAWTTASRVQGLVMVELGRQLPPFITDPGELFAREIERIAIELIQE